MKLITFNIAIPSSLLPPDWFKKLIYHHLFACISVGNKWKMKLCSFPRKNWKEYLSKPLLKFHLISGANLDWFNTTFVPCLISRWVPNLHSVACMFSTLLHGTFPRLSNFHCCWNIHRILCHFKNWLLQYILVGLLLPISIILGTTEILYFMSWHTPIIPLLADLHYSF